ncbi:HEAT repeat domain-containing protein [Arthrobacter sp. UYCu712]|uniref:HEAT repeat domain-containing protein n=1 Tax=Arthrobacter sp. UYCu712 TaxID=3156340 RepID=UPI003394329F
MRPRPQVLIESAVHLYGEDKVVEWAVALLAGQAAGDGPDIGLLGGSPGWAPYWPRVWGARAFLYAWNESAAPAAVKGLGDGHWRVREMCAKVCRRRELTEGSAALVELTSDPVERVRLSAQKAIGDICEADAAGPLLAAQFGSRREADVAAAALRCMEQRLDRRLR